MGVSHEAHKKRKCILIVVFAFSTPPPKPGALTKVKESQKHVEEGKMDRAQADGIDERCNIISCATLAEIQHFHRTRVRDFTAQLQQHLRQQIAFFQKITGTLQEALQKYDEA